MSTRKQFEDMLEALLINEDHELAKDIFHNMIVSKSREIYEELLAEDFNFDTGEDEKEDDELEGEESDEFGDEVDGEEGDEHEPEHEFGDEVDGEEGDIEDRVLDLEDALEELKAEFEQLMSDEKDEPEHADMFGGDESEGDEFAGDEHEEPLDESVDPDDIEDLLAKLKNGEIDYEEFRSKLDSLDSGEREEEEESMEEDDLYEYVEKVALPKHGDNGVQTRSPVACKNDMGGTTANIARGGVAKGEGTKGGLLKPSTKEENFGNVNVPGSKNSTKLSKVGAGHGAERKGTGEKAGRPVPKYA